MESYLSLLDQSRPLESIVKDFKLFNSQVSIHFDYDTLDSYASGREAGHSWERPFRGGLSKRNDKVSLLLSRMTIGFFRKATGSETRRTVGQY